MHAREIRKGIQFIATVHWERRLFDSLVPLPDGTSYNAYLIRGAEGTALLDTTDPALRDELLEQLQDVERIDYVVSQHSEQDHSGTIPDVLARYPEAKLLCSKKAEDLLTTHLKVDSARIQVVDDGESISLGDKTLQFVYTPWVHWPETMVTYVPEDRCLFSCDFFGSHLATIGLVALPGMMTGVILGGADPFTAIKYQIAIMIAIFSGTATTVFLAIWLTLRNSFTASGILNRTIFREKPHND